jgi:hypothetical protein
MFNRQLFAKPEIEIRKMLIRKPPVMLHNRQAMFDEQPCTDVAKHG